MENFLNTNNIPNKGVVGMPVPPKENHPIKNIMIILTVAVVLGLIVFGAIAYFGSISETEEVKSLETGEVVRKASENKVISGFPAELLLEDGVSVKESYSISYINQSVDMPVASFVSSLSYEENIKRYGDYLKNNGWEIMNTANPETPITYWYAKRGEENLNVAFDSRSGNVAVTIAYSKPVPVAE